MKKSYLLLALAFAFAAAAEEPKTEAAVAPAAEVRSEDGGHNLSNMGRGLVNVTTCFLEVPRCMVYRNSQVPLWGFIDGAVRGGGLTALRAFSGVTDLLFLGFDYGKMYNKTDFRDYVWESPWLPQE